MTFSLFVDRIYWAVLILSPLAYAALNFETYRKTRRTYMLVLFLVALSLFLTTSLSFLSRNSAFIHGNLAEIRLVLVILTIIRIPIDLVFYSKLLTELTTRVSPVPASPR